MIRVVLGVTGIVVLVMILIAVIRIGTTQSTPQMVVPPAARQVQVDTQAAPQSLSESAPPVVDREEPAAELVSISSTSGGSTDAASPMHRDMQMSGVGVRAVLSWDVPADHTLIVWGVEVNGHDYAAMTFPAGSHSVDVFDGAGYYVHNDFAAQEFCRTVTDARMWGGYLIDVQVPAGASC